jgi:hypothetical protein
MKKVIVLLALFAFVITACNKDGIPKEVKAKFSEMFPDIEAVWEKQDDGNFLATFTFEEIEWTALFGADGSWMKSSKNLDEASFPAKGVEYLKMFYPDLTPVYVMYQDEEGDHYLAEMTKEETAMEVLFDVDGNLVMDENNVIIASFNEKYAGAVNPMWEKKEDGNFKVDFTLEDLAWTALFGPDANWMKTYRILKTEEYPEAINEYFKKMKLVEITEVKKMIDTDGEKIKVKTMLKEKETCFIFDKDGAFLEKEEK